MKLCLLAGLHSTSILTVGLLLLLPCTIESPVQDIGPVAYGFRLLEKLIDLNALFTLASPIMHLMPDFQQQLAALRSSNKPAALGATGTRAR